MRSRIAFILALVTVLSVATLAAARTLLTQEEALKLAFPTGATLERESQFLTEAQLRQASELAGETIEGEIWIRYHALADGREVGFAYFDTHLVRTLPETLMVIVDPANRIAHAEIIQFSEPPDYLPKQAWYLQFSHYELGPELSLGRGIRGVTGATLSARAATAAARRVLAVHLSWRADSDPAAASATSPPTPTPSPLRGGK